VGDAEGDDAGSAEPSQPREHPVPCMKCRRTVWVPVGRTYVTCEECAEDD